MTRRLIRTGTTAGLALLFPLAMAPASSWADPKGEPFQLQCGSSTWMVTVNGNGEWTPAHDSESNKVLIPRSFGTFHGEVRDAQGNLVDSFDEPGTETKGSAKPSDVSCTFTFHEVSDGSDPEFPAGYTFHGVGTVTGKIAGR